MDIETVELLKKVVEHVGKSQSCVVREAVKKYSYEVLEGCK